jgi:hypothetical protein
MSRLTVDAAMREKLCKGGDCVEVCDEAGQVFGVFYQTRPGLLSKGLRSPFTEEQIQQFRKEKGGRPLAEVLKELGAS